MFLLTSFSVSIRQCDISVTILISVKAAYDCVTYETSSRNVTTQITAAWETKASLKLICGELARRSNVTRRRIDSKDE